MLDPIGSTSWPNRHRPYFLRLNELLLANSRSTTEPLRVVIAGPGAVMRLLRPFLHDASSDAPAWRRLLGDAARYTDQLLRRIPGVPLVSLEPAEVESALTVPHRLAVVDHSPRVLSAVAKTVPSAECRRVDLACEPLPFAADVIIAFNVICRIEAAREAMINLVAGLPIGGLLLADDRSTQRFLPPNQFEPVAEKTWRRRRT